MRNTTTTNHPTNERFDQAILQMTQVCPHTLWFYKSCAEETNNLGHTHHTHCTPPPQQQQQQQHQPPDRRRSSGGGGGGGSRHDSSCYQEFRNVKECFRKIQGI